MPRTFVYPAILTAASHHALGETGFVVTFPDLPEAVTQGETQADSLREAADCLEEAIANRTRRRLDIPAPSPIGEGMVAVGVRATVAVKAGLAAAMRDAGLSNVALAALLGKDEKEVRRPLDPEQGTKLATVEDALLRLGKRVRIVIEDAA